MMNTAQIGISLPNGTRVTHGTGGNIKRPLLGIPLVMQEFYLGAGPGDDLAFSGQFGVIEFNTECRLPRHVHIGQRSDGENDVLLPERILVLNGVGLTELGGEIFLVGPGSLVDIPPGLPHTWNACPPGIALPDGSVSTGHFTMVYNYSEPTRFYPTAQTGKLSEIGQYTAYEGDFEKIRFPQLTLDDVVSTANFVWNRDIRNDLKVQS
jgi:hypothetical protein